MRLHAEGFDEMEEEEKEAAVMASAALSPPLNCAAVAAPRIVVGYALTKKKVKSFLQPKLLLLARGRRNFSLVLAGRAAKNFMKI